MPYHAAADRYSIVDIRLLGNGSRSDRVNVFKETRPARILYAILIIKIDPIEGHIESKHVCTMYVHAWFPIIMPRPKHNFRSIAH